jgi:hypothetical protein
LQTQDTENSSNNFIALAVPTFPILPPIWSLWGFGLFVWVILNSPEATLQVNKHIYF